MFKNKTALWKIISDLKSDDTKVRLIGRLIDRKDDFIIIDDGTGTVIVSTNDLVNDKLEKIILVIGTVHQRNDGQIIIEAEIIKDFSDFNFELYLETYNLFKKNILHSSTN